MYMVKGSEVLRMTDPRPGELWLIRSADGQRRAIVCVLSLGRSVASVAFTDSEADLAYDEELVFEACSAAPLVVRLSPTLVGPVPRGAFLERVGAVPVSPDDLDSVSLGEWPPSLPGRRGLPLAGRSDPRWREAERRVDDIAAFLDRVGGD